jgi:hypothetical protein
MTKEISLGGKKSKGRIALVDDEDFDLVSSVSWCVQEIERPAKKSGPYAYGTLHLPNAPPRQIFMHKLITGWPMTDHINHDGLDNRRRNLRPTNHSLNAANQRPRSGTSSIYKGVAWSKVMKKWIAQAGPRDGRSVVGFFEDEIEAALAYDKTAKEIFGDHAYLNFPGAM